MSQPPTSEVRTELESVLREDRSRFGDVYRLAERGYDARRIADELGVRTTGFVSNYRVYLRALLEGEVPSAETLAQQSASQVRRILKSPQLSPAAQEYGQALLESLSSAGGPTVRSAAGSSRERSGPAQPIPQARSWKQLVAEELQRNYPVGSTFTTTDFYRRSEARLQAAYPSNTTVQATVLNILQRLRDDGLLEFLTRGEYRYLGYQRTTEAFTTPTPLAKLLEGLVERIANETSIVADDYLDIATDSAPLERVHQLLGPGPASPTLRRLFAIDRLDLTIEQLVVEHAEHFDDGVRHEARGRLDFYRAQ